MTVRYYSSTAQPTTLALNATPASTTIEVVALVGYPSSFPYTLCLDFDTGLRELVQVNNAAGTTLTVVRAVDGTSAVAHSAGATVRHVTSARDYADSRAHENASAMVHGITGSVVGDTDAQILTNKTLTAPVINNGTTNNQTINTPTINNPTIVGSISGVTLTNPTITGTVGGGATYSSPVLTTPSVSGGTFSTPTITTPTINTGGTWNGGPTIFTPLLVNPDVVTSLPNQVPLIVQSDPAQSVDQVQIYDKNSLKKNYIDSGGTFHTTTSLTDSGLIAHLNSGVANSTPAVIIRDSSNTTRANLRGNGQIESDASADTFMLYLKRPATVASDALVYERGGTPLAGITDAGNLYAQNFTVGAYNLYTPTWSSTGGAVSIGNGYMYIEWTRDGRMISGYMKMKIGSTTNVGGAGTWTWSLPVPSRTSWPAGDTDDIPAGTAFGFRPAVSSYLGGAQIAVGAQAFFLTANQANPWGHSQGPFPTAPTTNDRLYFEFSYEAAS